MSLGLCFICEAEEDLGGYYQNLATEVFNIGGKLKKDGVDIESYISEDGEEERLFDIKHLIKMLREMEKISKKYEAELFSRGKEPYLDDLAEAIEDLEKFSHKNLKLFLSIG